MPKMTPGTSHSANFPTPSPAEGWKQKLKFLGAYNCVDEDSQIDEIISSIEHQSYQKGRREGAREVVALYGKPNCDFLNHSKKTYHNLSEECPVVKKIEEYIYGLSDSSERE